MAPVVRRKLRIVDCRKIIFERLSTTLGSVVSNLQLILPAIPFRIMNLNTGCHLYLAFSNSKQRTLWVLERLLSFTHLPYRHILPLIPSTYRRTIVKRCIVSICLAGIPLVTLFWECMKRFIHTSSSPVSADNALATSISINASSPCLGDGLNLGFI